LLEGLTCGKGEVVIDGVWNDLKAEAAELVAKRTSGKKAG
jgi:hypothetical protein